MTATDELRRMLDERGVKWEDMSIFPLTCTSWLDHDGEPCTALEGTDDIPDGKLSVQSILTPAQAIAATLGTEACHMERDFTRWDDDDGYYVTSYTCSVCADSYLHIGNGKPKACPNCGRRIEVEE